jgi:glucose/arabinose dehydrogenase
MSVRVGTGWVPLIAIAAVVIGAVIARALLDGRAVDARDGPSPDDGVRLERVASGLDDPVYLTSPPGDPRLFVVEQPGRIRIIAQGRPLWRPFLDLTDRVRDSGERGLLSVAFHPRYASNGQLYVNYTDRDGDTRIERYTVSRDPGRADVASAKLLLRIEQPYANHNGGHIVFGPDGMLWIGMGDGGSGGDPHGNGQNLGTLLGKMLRIDVDRGEPYAIPPDNPFRDRRGARPEIWAFGLRNPWRFAFDPAESLVIIADVGQNRWEEVDAAPAGRGGLNYGWNRMEGAHCYGASGCDERGLVRPAFEYDHGEGCSVTGGFVYRGSALPALRGLYFYSDYCSGWIRSARLTRSGVSEHRAWRLGSVPSVSSFGLDARGELYVLSHSGDVYRLAPAPAAAH